VIWTSSSHSADDVFKIYAAEKVEQGSPLVIGQHGGGIGTHLWAFYEEHQISISDAYLSWGWTEISQPKIKPLGQFKSKNSLGIQHAKKISSTKTIYKYMCTIKNKHKYHQTQNIKIIPKTVKWN